MGMADEKADGKDGIKQTLLKGTKDRKLWRDIITLVLKGYGI